MGGLSLVLWLLLTSSGCFLGGPSQTALASTTTLSIIAGTVQVKPNGQTAFQSAQDGMTLRAGDQVMTLATAHALITFFEGSTVEIEPDSEVTIQALDGTAGQRTTVLLNQGAGTTWSRVVELSDQSSRFEIETPTAVAAVRGTLLQTSVVTNPATGQLETEVQTIEGSVAVSAAGQEVLVGAGLQTTVPQNQPPAPPAPIPPSPSRFEFSMHSPVWMLVVDPVGRAVGITPPGIVVNQVPGARVSDPFVEPQTMTLPDAPAGNYQIYLYGKGTGAYLFTLLGTAFDAPVIATSREGQAQPEARYTANLTAVLDGDVLTGGALSEFVVTREPPRAKVVQVKAIVDKVAPVATQVAATVVAQARANATPANATATAQAIQNTRQSFVAGVQSTAVSIATQTATAQVAATQVAAGTPAPGATGIPGTAVALAPGTTPVAFPTGTTIQANTSAGTPGAGTPAAGNTPAAGIPAAGNTPAATAAPTQAAAIPAGTPAAPTPQPTQAVPTPQATPAPPTATTVPPTSTPVPATATATSAPPTATGTPAGPATPTGTAAGSPATATPVSSATTEPTVAPSPPPATATPDAPPPTPAADPTLAPTVASSAAPGAPEPVGSPRPIPLAEPSAAPRPPPTPPPARRARPRPRRLRRNRPPRHLPTGAHARRRILRLRPPGPGNVVPRQALALSSSVTRVAEPETPSRLNPAATSPTPGSARRPAWAGKTPPRVGGEMFAELGRSDVNRSTHSG